MSLDIKNAFNSAWAPSVGAQLIKWECPEYLRVLVWNFLRDREIESEGRTRVCVEPGLFTVLSGAAPLACLHGGVVYADGATRLGIHVQAYADDQLIIVGGPTVKVIEREWVRVWGECQQWAFVSRVCYAARWKSCLSRPGSCARYGRGAKHEGGPDAAVLRRGFGQ